MRYKNPFATSFRGRSRQRSGEGGGTKTNTYRLIFYAELVRGEISNSFRRKKVNNQRISKENPKLRIGPSQLKEGPPI